MRLHCKCTYNQIITIHSRSRKSVFGKGTRLYVIRNTSRFQAGEEICPFSEVSRPGLGRPNLLFKVTMDALPEGKAPGVLILSLMAIQCPYQEGVELYINWPVCLHGLHRDNTVFIFMFCIFRVLISKGLHNEGS